MKKIKSVECSCNLTFPKNLMIGKECYLCVLGQWPPKGRKQLRDYEKAVSIRLGLNSPLTTKQGLKITKIVGLAKLGLLQEVLEGKVVPLKPVSTFYQRLFEKLEDSSEKL